MKIRNFVHRMGRTVCLPSLAVAGLFVLLSPIAVQSAHAQTSTASRLPEIR